MGIHRNTILEAINLQLAQAGVDIIARTAESYLSGRWCAIYNPDDVEISVSCTVNVGDKFTALKLCPNGTIYGDFATLKCNTNAKFLVAYRM